MRKFILTNIPNISPLTLTGSALALVLLWSGFLFLLGAFWAPVSDEGNFGWQAKDVAALNAANTRSDYRARWQALPQRDYPGMGDYLADQLDVRRSNPADLSTSSSLEGELTNEKGVPLAGGADNPIRQWSDEYLCTVQGWGRHAEQIRALVIAGVGECSLGQRLKARSFVLSPGNPPWDVLILAFLFVALALLSFVTAWLAIHVSIYNWLYRSRVI